MAAVWPMPATTMSNWSPGMAGSRFMLSTTARSRWRFQGFKGLAILSVDGKSQRITLDAGDGSKMTGKVTGNLPKQPKGVVQITPPGGKTVSAKF